MDPFPISRLILLRQRYLSRNQGISFRRNNRRIFEAKDWSWEEEMKKEDDVQLILVDLFELHK